MHQHVATVQLQQFHIVTPVLQCCGAISAKAMHRRKYSPSRCGVLAMHRSGNAHEHTMQRCAQQLFRALYLTACDHHTSWFSPTKLAASAGLHVPATK
jgi:hypothetical protein